MYAQVRPRNNLTPRTETRTDRKIFHTTIRCGWFSISHHWWRICTGEMLASFLCVSIFAWLVPFLTSLPNRQACQAYIIIPIRMRVRIKFTRTSTHTHTYRNGPLRLAIGRNADDPSLGARSTARRSAFSVGASGALGTLVTTCVCRCVHTHIHTLANRSCHFVQFPKWLYCLPAHTHTVYYMLEQCRRVRRQTDIFRWPHIIYGISLKHSEASHRRRSRTPHRSRLVPGPGPDVFAPHSAMCVHKFCARGSAHTERVHACESEEV